VVSEQIIDLEATTAPSHSQDYAKTIERRILHVVGEGDGSNVLHPSARRGWQTWWAVRQRVGGRVTTASFRAAVDALLASGALLEIYLRPRAGEDLMHILLLPGAASPLPRPVHRAHGRQDIIDVVLGEGWPGAEAL
jgi:hypothetical protein